MIRVLICTERRDDWLLASAFLARDGDNYDLQWVDSYQQAEHSVGRGDFDAYLVDAALGGGRGLALAEAAARRTPRPILVLSPRADQAQEKRALASGVADVLVRPEITPHWLDNAIRHALVRSERRNTTTGASTAEFSVLQVRLAQAVARGRRGLGGVAVLSVGIDWKSARSRGPAVADGALRTAATERLKACLRDIDTLCQTGDGFLIVVEDADARLVSARLADRVLSELAAPFTIRGEVYQVASSLGVSLFPDDGDSEEQLLAHARQSLDAVRAVGGEVMTFPSRQTDIRVARRIFLERALEGALERKDFYLVYQPQVDLESGDPIGCEALLRWKHPDLGLVSPGEFIPILEESNLIADVGRWVLETACNQVAQWRTRGIEVRVSVNVSAKQFTLGTVGESVAQALASSNLPARLLGVELTESVMLDSSSGVRETLLSLRDSGVYVSVDDFGTGYASLRYVKRFPMDAIKIDREFVRGLPLDVHNAAITNSIMALARSLNLGVVAEGVENEAEEEFLRSLDCRVIQGFLYSKPLLPDDFETWFIARKARQPRSRPALRALPAK